jgi:hypothetical protein
MSYMSTCTPSKWNSKEIRDLVIKIDPYRAFIGPRKWAMVLEYYNADRTTLNLSMKIRLLSPAIGDYPVCSVGIKGQPMGHCGIVEIMHLSPGCNDLRTLWLQTIETFLYVSEFSLVIASDGPYYTANYIEQCGKHWEKVSKPHWINRRMGSSHVMNVYMRYLNHPKPEIEIDWTNVSYLMNA